MYDIICRIRFCAGENTCLSIMPKFNLFVKINIKIESATIYSGRNKRSPIN